MNNHKTKMPYFLLVIGILSDIFAIGIAVTIYLFMKENAANFAMHLLMLSLPIITSVIIFLDLRFKVKDIKLYWQKRNS